MSCISLGGFKYSPNPIRFFDVLLTLERPDKENGEENDNGGDGENDEVERENCVSCRLNEKFLEWKVIMIPKVKPIAKKRM